METETMEAMVRERDRERWLATLWAPRPARAALFAIHAYDLEQQRILADIKEPLLAEMRLAWWREQLAAIAAGREAPAQPLLQALAGDAMPRGVDLVALSRVEDGLLPLLDEGAPDLGGMARTRGGAVFGAIAQALGEAPVEGAGTAFALGRLQHGGWGVVAPKVITLPAPDMPAPAPCRLPATLAVLDGLGRDDIARAQKGRPPAEQATAGRQWRMLLAMWRN